MTRRGAEWNRTRGDAREHEHVPSGGVQGAGAARREPASQERTDRSTVDRGAGRTAGRAAGRTAGAPASDVCGEARAVLCRAAADAGVPARALRAAVVHTRACRECHRFAHRLGTACAWLDERSRQASPLGGGRSGVSSAPSGGASFIGVLRRALARQLGARLARDLADWARGGGGRLPAIRRRDVRRLTALLPSAERRRPPWGRALLLARRERPPDRPPVLELLGLATALDPEGVDLSLEYVRQLVRHEEHARAEAEADRAVAYLA